MLIICQTCHRQFSAEHSGSFFCPFCGSQTNIKTTSGAPRRADARVFLPTVRRVVILALVGHVIACGDRQLNQPPANKQPSGAQRQRTAPAPSDAVSAPKKNTERVSAQKEQAAAFVPAIVERIDCQKKGSPGWCNQIAYASKREKKGTVAVIIRSTVPGSAHMCVGDKYISEVGDADRVPKSVLEELKATVITLEPRNDKGNTRYFIVPHGTKPDSLKWMKPCPLGKGADPCPKNDCIKNTLGIACTAKEDVPKAVRLALSGNALDLPGCKWLPAKTKIQLVDVGWSTARIVEVDTGQTLYVVREAIEW